MNRFLLSSLAGSLLPLQALAAQTAPGPSRLAPAPEPAALHAVAEFSLATDARSAPGAVHAPAPEPDFLFGAPAVSLGVRGGLNVARAGSDLYDFLTDEFTLDQSDFRSVALSVELAVRLSSRIDGVIGLGRSALSARSEYWDWLDQDDLPIEQTTRLRQIPLTAGAKIYLTPRGEAVGQFAWIPAKVALFAGGGGGLVHYRFAQEGAFVDFVDLTIFDATLESSGWAPTAYVSLGADLRLTPATFVSLEARGILAETELERDFVAFEPIDLSGLQLTLGLHRSI